MNNLNNNNQSNPLMGYPPTPEGYVDDLDITRPYVDGAAPAVATAKDPYITNQDCYDDWDTEVLEGGVQENSLPSLQNSQLNNNRRLS